MPNTSVAISRISPEPATAFISHATGMLAALISPYCSPARPFNLIPFQSQAQLSGNLPPHTGADALRLGMQLLWVNVLIFVPLGVFLPLLFPQRWR